MLVALMWAMFPKPTSELQRLTYLALAVRVAGMSEWIHYRAEEWIMELER